MRVFNLFGLHLMVPTMLLGPMHSLGLSKAGAFDVLSLVFILPPSKKKGEDSETFDDQLDE